MGILIGHKDYGGLVSDTNVSGQLFGMTAAYVFEGQVFADEARNIGGLIGFDDGDGTVHLRNSVDVLIDVRSEKNLSSEARALAMDLIATERTSDIGGYVGETDEDSTFRFLNVKSEIKIESHGNVEDVGGVVGENEAIWSELDVDSKIHIVSLGDRPGHGELQINRIGGVFGYSDDQTVQLSNVASQILIESADVENNSQGVSTTGERIVVSRVGGVSGEHDDDTSDAYVRVKADIEIRNVAEIELVGGYFGEFDDDNGIGLSDNFVSGSIRLNAQNSIENIGGYGNLENSGLLTGRRMFSAMAITTSGTATTTSVNPYIGLLGSPAKQLAFDSFWDSDLTNLTNPADYPGAPASTAQLTSKAFLTNLGMDFADVWQIRPRSYPELRPGAYTWGFEGGTSSGSGSSSSAGSGSSSLAGPSSVVIPKKARVGQRVVVRGLNLNRVTGVFVAGKKVNYTLRTNGTLSFSAPKVKPGRYLVRLTSDAMPVGVKQRMRISQR